MASPPASRPPEPEVLRAALALALGALHAASFSPPLDAWWLQIAALAALIALVAPTPGASLRHCATNVFAFGLGWFAIGLAWLHTSMHVYGGMPWALAALALALFAAYLAAFPVLAITLAQRATRGADGRTGAVAEGLGYALALGAAWGLTEWLRGMLFTGFPWLAIGYAHVDGPLAGFAPWIGVYGVSALAACVAALVAEVAVAPRRVGASIGAVALAAVILAGGAALARIELTQPSGAAVSVRLVQGNVPQQLKFDGQRAYRAMHEYADALEQSPATLTVLPETAWVVPWDSTPADIAQRLVASLGGGTRFAAIGMPLPAAGDTGAMTRLTNSVALVGGADPLARYDKRHLVPFGEFIPPGFAWFVRLMQIPLGEFGRGGAEQAPFTVGAQRFAFNICYEDLFGEEIAAQVRGPQGASVLVNVSNLAWFGDSHALPQHLAIARMRTLETGRPMLRATNTGVTAAIDHRGRVLGRLDHARAAVLDAQAQGTAGLTPYVRWGNWTSGAVFAVMIALAIALVRMHRRTSG